jgi:hypothetical protein
VRHAGRNHADQVLADPRMKMRDGGEQKHGGKGEAKRMAPRCRSVPEAKGANRPRHDSAAHHHDQRCHGALSNI